jgi:hypothetical protein
MTVTRRRDGKTRSDLAPVLSPQNDNVYFALTLPNLVGVTDAPTNRCCLWSSNDGLGSSGRGWTRKAVPHFIPTSSSWVNLVERWFGELTQKAVRRGAFASVPDLVETIGEFLAAWNENPRPFVWTAKLEDILKKIERARAKLESIKPGSAQPRRRQKREE